MLLSTILVVAAVAAPALAASNISVPSLNVPACPAKGTVTYDKSVPDLAPFPLTKVEVCYDDSHIDITFTAYNETNFFRQPQLHDK